MPKEPPIPAGATIPAPTSPAAQAATQAFLQWVQAALDWGRSLSTRADVAKVSCER